MTFSKRFEIEGVEIGGDNPCFIIAEAGVNHFGKMERAYKLVDMAVKAGCQAVKFQHFSTEEMISSTCPDWQERMRPKELSLAEHKKLQDYCSKKNITYLCSAHDQKSFNELIKLDLPAYKIGSGEKNNPEFIQHIASQNKPIILSTGMYSMRDVEEALEAVLSSNNSNLALLQCTTLYPTKSHEVNLRVMDTYRQRFNCLTGYSDHTKGYDIVLGAVARGASVIEKHIALERSIPNTQDPLVSCLEDELIEMCQSIRRIEQSLGSKEKQPTERELKETEWATKSVFSAEPIKKGETLTRQKICFKRPDSGIAPNELDQFLGKKIMEDLEADSPITAEMIVE